MFIECVGKDTRDGVESTYVVPVLPWFRVGIDSTFPVAAGPRNNVWSSTFDPGRNANMKKMGSSYYDKPSAENKSTVWEEHIASQKAQPEPTAMNNAAGSEGSQKQLDSDTLRKMMDPQNVNFALHKLDPSGTGKVDLDEVRCFWPHATLEQRTLSVLLCCAVHGSTPFETRSLRCEPHLVFLICVFVVALCYRDSSCNEQSRLATTRSEASLHVKANGRGARLTGHDGMEGGGVLR